MRKHSSGLTWRALMVGALLSFFVAVFAPYGTLMIKGSQMAFYRLLNDPFALLERPQDVKQTPFMAHESPEYLLAV